MGNQGMSMKFKSDSAIQPDTRKPNLKQRNSQFLSEIFPNTELSLNNDTPIYISVNKKSLVFDRSDDKPKEFYDEMNSVPTLFKWTGTVNKSISVSGSFNNWKVKVPLTKSEDETYYTIISCAPGTYFYKFFIDGNWYHDPNQPTIKNNFGTMDNIIEVKDIGTATMEALLSDENPNYQQNQCSMISVSEFRANTPPGVYTKDIPTRTLRDYDVIPVQMPLYLNESILDSTTLINQEPSLLVSPHHVQLNHMYASSIKDGLICLSATIRYRSKFITIILYRSIPT